MIGPLIKKICINYVPLLQASCVVINFQIMFNERFSKIFINLLWLEDISIKLMEFIRKSKQGNVSKNSAY